MASSAVNLKLDTEDRIWFAHAPSRAFFFTLVSLGFTWICWHFIRDEPTVRIIFVAFSLLFVIAGVLGFFWRMELDIDLTRRQVRLVRGMWPAPETSTRPLDEADGVWLTMKYRSSGSKNKRRVPWWFINLKFPDEKKGTRLFATRSEVAGYKKWEYYAKRLQLDAIDATAEDPQRHSWQDLDDSLAVQSKETDSRPQRVPEPPPGSKIELLWDQGQKEILLPAPGFSAGLVFLFLFGGTFAALGGSFLLATLRILDATVQGSELSQMIIPPIFILIGLGIIWIGIRGSFSALIIGVENGELFTQNQAFGKRSGRKSVPLNQIESVGVGKDIRSRNPTGQGITVGGVTVGNKRYRSRDNEVVVRSDQKILRFGRGLTATDRAWLADACYFAAIRGQLP